MISGIRLTQLDHGEPLLGTSLTYNDLNGVQAAEKRLEKLFSVINYFGFKFVIDTINPTEDANGNVILDNNGLYGHIWSFEERMTMYRKYQSLYGFNLVMEVNLPKNLNESNWKKYAEFIKSIMLKYNDILYWQICDEPETVVNQQFKCDPVSYVKLIKSLNNIKIINNNIQLGAPGIYQGLIDFYNDKPNCWFSRAIGDVYVSGESEYDTVGETGFLPYIDFFTIHGRQEISALRYEIFGDVILKLKNKIFEKIGKDITILSIDQGRSSTSKDQSSLDTQGYYEIKEILNAYKHGVYCFKNQLIDEYTDPYAWGGYFNENLKGRGLLYNELGDNAYKPAANTYQFILSSLSEFSYVGPTNKVSELNPNVESITLYNGDPNATSPTYQPTKSATILWSNSYGKNYAVLTPHYAREYMAKVGDPIALTQSVKIDFSEYDFVIVYETLEQNILDIDGMTKKLENKLSSTEKTLLDLVGALPNSYNKEITDINYYKLLRALSLELADAKVEINTVKHNAYLEDVSDDALYNNFGVLIGLNKRSEWDNDKYRRLVKGVTKSLLNGPTVDSITEAVKLFTNFDINIKELYKEDGAEETIGSDRTQFVFAIEVEKPLEVSSSQEDIIRDVDYVIDIVKPAHALRLIIISLVGTENYREQYADKNGIEFKDNDKLMSFDLDKQYNEGTFGWKDKDYDGQVKTACDEFIEYNPLINGGLFLGPRYSLFDDMVSIANFDEADKVIKEWIETMDSLLSFEREEEYHDVDESYDVNAVFNENEHRFGLDTNDLIQLRGRQVLNGILVKNKILNKYKLGFTTKLKDESKIEVFNFNSEKYIFNNLINPFIFRKDTDHVDSTVNHFPMSINGKFTYSQDILAEMEQKFTDLYLTDDRRDNMESGMNVFLPLNYQETFEEVTEEEQSLLALHYNEKFDKPTEQESVESVYTDKFDSPDEENSNHVNLDNVDYYRRYKVQILENEKRIKYIKQVVEVSNLTYMRFPMDDLLCADYNEPDVWVNGKILSKSKYFLVKDDLYSNYYRGIRFLGRLNIGDTIIMSYFQNRRMVFEEPPIKEEQKSVLVVNKKEIYDSINEIDDVLVTEQINSEIIDDVTDERTVKIDHIGIELYDASNTIIDILHVDFPHKLEEESDWNYQIPSTKRFRLGRSKLGAHNLMYGDPYSKEYVTGMEVVQFENINQMQEELEPQIIDVVNSETIRKPVDVIVFYLDGQENNIVKDKNIQEETEAEYCKFETYDKAEETSLIYRLDIPSIMDVYKFKKDDTENDLRIQYLENVQLDNVIDHCESMEVVSIENINKPVDENNNEINYDMLESDINKSQDSITEKTFNCNEHEALKLQDNLNKAYKFNMMRFVGSGNVYDGYQMINGQKVTLYKFPYKPIIDYMHNEVLREEKYNVKDVVNKFNANNNNFYSEKYSFKEDTFEFS